MLSAVLSDPEAMEQLKNTAAQLFGEKKEQPAPQPAQSLDMGGDLLTVIGKIAPILRGMQDDDATRLLRALEPFLSDERKQRAKEAEKIMQIIKILPALKGQNII
ncbi:MAG: hypothetical protein IJL87_04015 [Clostridia bacterium]|nr:hypothetical protein [Clostridia bacterium]